jgi:hypothetical protein
MNNYKKEQHSLFFQKTPSSRFVHRAPLHWVKIQLLFENQQVTNAQSKLVGTSEAIRPLTYHSFALSQEKKELSWNQWLAGLIDGDGSLLISPAGYMCCEITMGLKDEHALQQVKAKLGGSVKLRAGSRAIRYRLHHKKGIEELVRRIHREIRNSVRQKQFKLFCEKLDLPWSEPSALSRENAWFAGFFDADGTITLSIKRGTPQVTISVSNKKAQDLIGFQTVFSGNIYYDKSCDGYKWSIQSQADLLSFLDYIKKYPSRSSKKGRLFLLPRYFELKSEKAYQADLESLRYKAWTLFQEKWISFIENKREDDL